MVRYEVITQSYTVRPSFLGLQFVELPIPSRERPRLSLFASLLIHTVFILGVGFTAATQLYQPPEPLIFHLTLAHANDTAPLDARILASQSHTGSGIESENDQNSQQSQAIVLQSQLGTDRADSNDLGQQTLSVQALLVTDRDVTDIMVEAPTNTLLTPEQQALSYSRALELISRYAGEVDQLEKQSSDLSRHTFISSSTRESHYAAYIEAWRRQVETVGNRNYPEIARQQNLSGELVLAVAIDRDGLLRSIRVTRSSGIKVLDDAAIQITALAAPFEPLPEAIVQETDVLHISRTWQFMENARLINR